MIWKRDPCILRFAVIFMEFLATLEKNISNDGIIIYSTFAAAVGCTWRSTRAPCISRARVFVQGNPLRIHFNALIAGVNDGAEAAQKTPQGQGGSFEAFERREA